MPSSLVVYCTYDSQTMQPRLENCLKSEKLIATDKAKAVKEAEAKGWVLTPSHTWACPNCALSLPKPTIEQTVTDAYARKVAALYDETGCDWIEVGKPTHNAKTGQLTVKFTPRFGPIPPGVDHV